MKPCDCGSERFGFVWSWLGFEKVVEVVRVCMACGNSVSVKLKFEKILDVAFDHPEYEFFNFDLVTTDLDG